MNLNPSQLQAVHHDKGPLLIVAGAGTGKTTVITERIRYLVEDQKVDPYSIFATTFTDKAATEMETRLDKVMPFGYRAPWIGTFHSVCERILRQEALEIGLSPSFTIMTKTDTWILIKSHLYDFDLDYYRPLGNPTKFIDALITFFGRLSDEDVDLAEFATLVNHKADAAQTEEEVAEAKRLKELLGAFSTYQLIKQNEKKMDFSDLISQTLRLFRSRANVLSRYQQQFKHMLIDEFQDTNIAQFELIKRLAPPTANPNLIIVGDDNQSIYKFRSASVSNILQFMDLYPQAKSIVLTDNYRSTQSILDSAYSSITRNNPDTLESKLGISKQLVSHRPDSVLPAVYHFDSYVDEVDWTLAEINRLIAEEGIDYKDIAILARANSHLDPFVTAFQAAGLPFQRVSNGGLYDQPLISNLITFLKVLTDPADSLTLYSLLSSNLFKLDAKILLEQLIASKNLAISFWQHIEGNEYFQDAISLINQYRDQVVSLPVSRLLRNLIEQKEIISHLVEADSIENQISIKNLNLFFNILKQFELNNQNATLPFFMEAFESWEEAGDNPGQAQLEDIDVVSLSTVHKAKGLEFKAVFIVNLLAGRFPGTDRKDKILVPVELVKETLNSGDEHLQEERRLFYVALTRAKQFLYLTFSPDMGGAKKWKPSGFLTETSLEITNKSSDTILNPGNASKTALPKTVINSIEKISYSKIDAFRACPLRFKYSYIDKIPTFSSYQAEYGTALHQILYHLHLSQKTGHPISFEDLDAQFTQLIDKIIIEEELKDIFRNTAHQALSQYYHQEQHKFGTPIMLEEPFSIRLENGGIVTGKIDRIDKLANGSHIIIDYKTGEVRNQEDVDKDEQLTLYALAARDIFNISIDSVNLYFFNRNQLVTTTRTDKKLDNYKKRLEVTWDTIQTSDFAPKASEQNCRFCEFQKICRFVIKKKQS
jgi:DNA helicase II / ATP-dependent DNA helicase PcrA